MKVLWLLIGISLAAMACGCGGKEKPSGQYVKPTVAVMKFENRAAFPMRWDLGTGTRDMLVDGLMRTDRFHVIERPELDSVVGELNFQKSGMTREENKAAVGRLKNVQYLIKGTITDFSQVSAIGGSAKGSSGGGGASVSTAVVSIIMYVVDVESGEITTSESVEQSVNAGAVNFDALYKGVTYGGSAFYKTPLGEATQKVIDRAVTKITSAIANKPWTPRIAAVQPDGSVVLNGGTDRGVIVGQHYELLEQGAPILDPDTGDVLGRQTDRSVGMITVTVVQDRISQASVQKGTAPKVGQLCRFAK